MNFRTNFKSDRVHDLFSKLTNGFFYLGSSVAALVFSLVTFPIYSTYLSAEDFGLISYFNSLKGFLVPLFNLSLSNFFLMRFFNQNEEKNKQDLFNILFYLSINNIIVSVFSLFIGYYYFELFEVSYPFFPFSILILLSAYFEPYKMFLLQQYRIRKEGGKYFVFAVLAPIMNALISVFLLVFLDLGVLGRMAGLSLSMVILGLTCLIFIRKFVSPNYSFRDFKEKIITILPLAFASYFYIPIETFDRIFLERLKKPEILGLYSIGLQISGFFLVAATALFKAFEPSIFHGVIQKDKIKLKREIMQYCSILLIGYGTFFYLIDPMVTLLTRGKFIEAAYFAKSISFARLVSAISLVFTAIILARQKVRESAYVIYAISFCSIMLYPILTRLYGFDGAVAGRIACPLIGVAISFFIVKKIGI